MIIRLKVYSEISPYSIMYGSPAKMGEKNKVEKNSRFKKIQKSNA